MARLLIISKPFTGMRQIDELYSKISVTEIVPEQMSVSATRSTIQSSDLRQKRMMPTANETSPILPLSTIQYQA